MNDTDINVETLPHTKNYDWNSPLCAGSVVLAGYNDFTGNRKAALFLILYDEQFDSDVPENKNVYALKLTTQSTLLSNYIVRINMRENSFLNSPSLVCCSKPHILHKVHNIYNVLGVLDSRTMKNVYRMYKKFANEIDRQTLESI